MLGTGEWYTGCMRTRTGPTVALSGLILISLATAGCGGGGSAKDLTAGLTPAELARQSQAATKPVVAYKLAATGQVQADIGTGRLPELLTGLLKTPVKIDGVGPVNDDAVSFDFSVALTGLPAIQANVTKVDGGLFAALLGTDYKVDLPAAQVGAFRPADLAGDVLSLVGDPREVAREEVDGTKTVHLSGSIDVARVLETAAGLLGSIQGSPVSAADVRKSIPELEAALKEHTVDVWIGTADLLPRRAVVKLRFDGTVKALPEVTAAAVDLDMRFSEFGKAVEITAPQTTETLDLNRLRSLAP